MSFLAAPTDATCAAGLREVYVDDTGHVTETVRSWRCDLPAIHTAPMVCPGCGNRTEVAYCFEHMADAVRGTMFCILCPERTTDLA